MALITLSIRYDKLSQKITCDLVSHGVRGGEYGDRWERRLVLNGPCASDADVLRVAIAELSALLAPQTE